MELPSIIFKVGCAYYNWKNKRNGSGSGDTQGLQNPVAEFDSLQSRQSNAARERRLYSRIVSGSGVEGHFSSMCGITSDYTSSTDCSQMFYIDNDNIIIKGEEI